MLPKCIVAIGASSFFGRVDPEGGGFIGRLKTWHESNHRKNRVYNLGISSETSTDLLKRLIPECTPRKPDLIILGASSNDSRHIGSKDATCETPMEEYVENLQQLIKQARAFCPVLVITGSPIDERRTSPLTLSNKYFSMKDLTTYLDTAKEVCRRLEVPCLDIFSEWMATDYQEWLWDDGLHPNALGHQKIFELLKTFLITHFDLK